MNALNTDLAKTLQEWALKLFPGGIGQIVSFFFCLLNGLFMLFLILPFFTSKHTLPIIPPEYLQMIPDIYHGNGLRWMWSNTIYFAMAKEPGYPLFLAMFFTLFGKFNVLPIQLTQIFLNGLICYMIWMITFKSSNKTSVATIASMSYAFHPLPLWYSVRIWNDIPTSFLLIVSVFLLFSTLQKKSFFFAALTGFCFGIATLFRIVSFSVLMIIIALITSALIKKQGIIIKGVFKFDKVRLIKLLCILLTFFVVAISPWIIRNTLICGIPAILTIQGWGSMIDGAEIVRIWKPEENVYQYSGEMKKKILVKNYYLEEQQVYPEKTPGEIEISVNNKLKQTALREIKNEPFQFIKKVIMNLFFFWYLGTQKIMSSLLLLINMIILPFAIIGASISIKQNNLYLTIFVFIALFLCILQSFIVGYSRYSVPVLPYVMPLSAYAFYKLLKK